ncbi:hypothetical protein JYU34_013825 [Plutella xylostella]|uniref:Cytochrome b5 heme-binding domain-containing protein n=1 Tax=Plutella xylostella TaxID=51655 RepID=A0ABQ7QAQ9_PLUXY|nr:cytochrome b5 isoform X4 [Plutella xylostella]KAG7302327.1 hypothetical protein JYU34_013825 [Plutella xylostella]
MSRIISREEVKKHHRCDSTWIIIANKVYDVTSFLEEHPGGADSLLEVAGQDGTRQFEDVGHSEDARKLLKKYYIGDLPVSEAGEGSSWWWVKYAIGGVVIAIIGGLVYRKLSSPSPPEPLIEPAAPAAPAAT